MPLDVFSPRNTDAFAVTRQGFGPGLDPDFWESFGSAFGASANTLRGLRIGAARYNVIQDWLDKLEAETGYAPPNPELSPDPAVRARLYDEMRKRYAGLGDGSSLPAPPTFDEAQKAAMDAERGYVAADAAVQGRPQTIWSRAGGVFGGIGGLAVDPVNLGAMAVGWPVGAGIVATALREAGIAAASQAGIEALGYDLNREIIPGYGPGMIAANIAMAGAGGAVFGGGIKGLAAVWSRFRTGSWPRYVIDGGNALERQAVTEATNPNASAGGEGSVNHIGNVLKAEEAVTAGRQLELPPDQITGGTYRPSRVFDAAGRPVDVRYQVVEADTLIGSHNGDFTANPDYPAALQPRDRTRPISAEQVTGIASRLEPERLGPSPDAGTGAPVVGPDNIVESGNGRLLALRQVFGADGEAAGRYRAFLKALGYDTENMRSPVLIARRVTPLTEPERVAFADAANRASVARMSAPEQAMADARKLDEATLSKLDPERSLETGANSEFNRAFVRSLPDGERGGLVDRDGRLSQEGVRRAQAALFARAYADPALLARVVETTDTNLRAIGGALIDTAPRWARLRDTVSRGTVPAQMDITADLLAAVRLVERARDGRIPLLQLVDQAEMFNAPSPITRALLGAMFRDEALTKAVSRSALARGLNAFAEEAAKNTAEARLFGDALSASDVLGTALKKVGREDLAALADEQLTLAAIDKTAAEPVAGDAVVHDLEHLQDNAPADLEIPDPYGLTDAEGRPVMRKVSDLIDEADAEIKAANEIEGCASGAMAAAPAA